MKGKVLGSGQALLLDSSYTMSDMLTVEGISGYGVVIMVSDGTTQIEYPAIKILNCSSMVAISNATLKQSASIENSSQVIFNNTTLSLQGSPEGFIVDSNSTVFINGLTQLSTSDGLNLVVARGTGTNVSVTGAKGDFKSGTVITARDGAIVFDYDNTFTVNSNGKKHEQSNGGAIITDDTLRGKIKFKEDDSAGYLEDKISSDLKIGTDGKLSLSDSTTKKIDNAKQRYLVNNTTIYFSDISPGDDANDGFTPSTPKKSIENFLLSLDDMELYSETGITTLTLRILGVNPLGDITINSLSGISLNITTSAHIASGAIYLNNCENSVTVTRLNPTKGVRIVNCRNVTCSSLYSTTTTDSGFYIAGGSKVFLDGCKITGAEDGIYATENSDVMAYNFLGKGYDTGVTASNGAHVRVSGAVIHGTNNDTVEIMGGKVDYLT